ncbi:MAG: hypothetical protein AAF085_14455 [Planctomycetota bacterium]
MFRCKQCGGELGPNTPKVCPHCGAENKQAVTEAKGVSALLAIETIATLVVLAGVVVIVVWIAGWF